MCQFLDTQAIYDWLRPSSCSHPYWTSFLYFNAASSAMLPSSAGAGGSENFQTGSTRAQPRLTSVLMATHLFLPFTTSKSSTRRFSRQISSSYQESNISKILRKKKIVKLQYTQVNQKMAALPPDPEYTEVGIKVLKYRFTLRVHRRTPTPSMTSEDGVSEVTASTESRPARSSRPTRSRTNSTASSIGKSIF